MEMVGSREVGLYLFADDANKSVAKTSPAFPEKNNRKEARASVLTQKYLLE
jgi:hypothetical protein